MLQWFQNLEEADAPLLCVALFALERECTNEGAVQAAGAPTCRQEKEATTSIVMLVAWGLNC